MMDSAAPFFVVIAVVVVELLMSGTFNRFYFTVGLPIFRRQAGCSLTANRPPATAQLEAATTGGAFPSMVFRDLGDSKYAFREAAFSGLFKFTYTPMMHGLMTFDRQHRCVRVVGLANWFPIAFFGLFALFVLDTPWSEAGVFVAFAFGIVLFIYAIQARRFSKIADSAAALWSKSTGNPLVVDDAAGGHSGIVLKRLSQVFVASVVAVPLLAMVLMLIGAFTEEWTCQEEGGGWKCVGGHECLEASNKRFDGHPRKMSCKRTDWPMIPLEKLGDFLHEWLATER